MSSTTRRSSRRSKSKRKDKSSTQRPIDIPVHLSIYFRTQKQAKIDHNSLVNCSDPLLFTTKTPFKDVVQGIERVVNDDMFLEKYEEYSDYRFLPSTHISGGILGPSTKQSRDTVIANSKLKTVNSNKDWKDLVMNTGHGVQRRSSKELVRYDVFICVLLTKDKKASGDKRKRTSESSTSSSITAEDKSVCDDDGFKLELDALEIKLYAPLQKTKTGLKPECTSVKSFQYDLKDAIAKGLRVSK